MRLDIKKSAALSATVQTLATIPKDVAKEVRTHTKAVVEPEWKKGLAGRAANRTQHERLVGPATTYISDRGVRLVAGSNRADNFTRETEFGSYREEFNTYRRRSPRGKSHPVTRRTQKQFYHYTKKGHVVYPTAENMIPRIASLWVQTTYRTVAESLEKAGAR